MVSLKEDKVLTSAEQSARSDSGGGTTELSVSGVEEGSRDVCSAEMEGEETKLDLLHGGDFSKSRRSTIPRMGAMSKYCPSTRYEALNALHSVFQRFMIKF